jgi:hypothetical protein
LGYSQAGNIYNEEEKRRPENMGCAMVPAWTATPEGYMWSSHPDDRKRKSNDTVSKEHENKKSTKSKTGLTNSGEAGTPIPIDAQAQA